MDKLSLNQAFFIARQYVQNKPFAWDHLEGTNDLNSYLSKDMTEKQVLAAAEKAYEDRRKEHDSKIKS